MEPRRLRRVLAAMKLRGLSVYSSSHAPAPHPMPTTVAEVGKRHASAGVTALLLFAIGIALSLFTGHSAFRGGLRLLLIGGGAGLAAWGVGKLLGASIA